MPISFSECSMVGCGECRVIQVPVVDAAVERGPIRLVEGRVRAQSLIKIRISEVEPAEADEIRAVALERVLGGFRCVATGADERAREEGPCELRRADGALVRAARPHCCFD